MDSCLGVEPVGIGGGLAMLWKDNSSLSLRSYFKNHIDMNFIEGNAVIWRLTCIYDEPVTYLRDTTWNFLRRLLTEARIPWVCLGDLIRSCGLLIR